MNFDEDNFEDELDRMRTRKQRKKSGRADLAPVVEEDGDDFLIYDDLDELDQDREPETEQETVREAYRPKKRKAKRKKILFKIILAVLAVLTCFALFKRVREDGYWTVAVFGVDSRDGSLGKGALSDVEMICSINKKTGEIRLVSVFRDSYLQIDSDGTYHKINEAYFKGGHQQAVDALERNLDLHIDDYVTFNWKAVVDAINVLGGVDLEITDKEFAYINSFITETVNSTGVGSYQLEHSGTNHLDGVQAVAYARLRLMDTDFNRTERQRKILQLSMDKVKGADFRALKTLVGAVYPQVSTSIGVDDLLVMAKDARKYYIGQTSGFPFSHTEMKIGKMDCVVPATLESNVIQLHQLLYDVNNYTPSTTVKKISAHISEKSGIGDPGKDTESNRTNGQNSSGSSGNAGKKPAATDPALQETAAPETESTPEENTDETQASDSTEETIIEASESSEESSSASDGSVSGPGGSVTNPGSEPGTGAQPDHTAEETEPTTTAATTAAPEENESEEKTTGALEGPGQNSGDAGEAAGPGM